MFAHLNTNKRSAVVEVAPSGADVARGAPRRGRPRDRGTRTPQPRRLGHRPRRAASPSDPRDSVVAITGFGATGPYADYAWSDLVAQAFSGALVMDRRGPLKLPMSLGESGGRSHRRARRAGRGPACPRHRRRRARRLLGRGGARVHAGADLALPRVGVPEPPRPMADGDPRSSDTLLPLGVFPCADGYVAMMMTTQQLGEMLTVLGSDELREAFARPDAFVRPETKEILDGVLYPWLFERTREEVTDAAQAAGWPVTPGQRAGRAADGGPPPPARVLGARRRRGAGPVPPARVRRTGSPRAAGRCGGPRRVSASATHRTGAGDVQPPAPPVAASRSRGAAAAGHPGARPHHGVVGAVPHRAPRPTSAPR